MTTKLGGRGGYRGIPKPKLPHHLKRVHVNARIQRWMLDALKKKRRGRICFRGYPHKFRF